MNKTRFRLDHLFANRLSPLGKLFVGIVIALTFSLPSSSDLGEEMLKRVENRSIDYRFLIRGPRPYTRDMPISLVFITNEAAMKYGYRSPTPRKLVAELLHQLYDKGAAVIGVDILLDRPYAHDPGVDEALEEALRRTGDRVVLVTDLKSELAPDATTPADQNGEFVLPRFEKLAHQGYSVSKSEGDDFHRWSNIYPYARQNAFAATAYKLYAGRDFQIPPRLGLNREEPWMLMNFPGPPSRKGEKEANFQVYSADWVRHIPEKFFKDRIVLIGSAIEDLGDVFLTPFSTEKNGYRTTFGVELQAITLSMLLTGDFIYFPNGLHKMGLLFGFFLAMAAIFLFSRPVLGLGTLPVGMLAWAGASVYAFLSHSLMLPIAYPVVAVSIIFMVCEVIIHLTEQRQSRFLKNTFQHYISPQLVEKLLSGPQEVTIGGDKQELSIFFSDLAGFTSISEKLEAERLMNFMHLYFDEMTRILFAEFGTLDKYIGDAIMAFFGAPNPLTVHARHACRTAIMMQRRIDALNAEQPPGWVQVRVRMGIHTADVFVGNTGSKTRFNYTVMGDGVNLASRMEGINKMFETRILVSESTLAHVAAGGEADLFFTREVGRFVVKGKARPVAVFELIGFAEDASEERRRLKEEYEAALRAFYAKDFQTARTEFDRLAGQCGDGAAAFMLQQIEYIAEHPVSDAWEGEVLLLTK